MELAEKVGRLGIGIGGFLLIAVGLDFIGLIPDDIAFVMIKIAFGVFFVMLGVVALSIANTALKKVIEDFKEWQQG